MNHPAAVERRPNAFYLFLLLTPLVWGVMLWALLYPHPRALALGALLALPPLGIVLCWTFGDCTLRKGAPITLRAVLQFTLLVVAGFVVGKRALSDVRLLEYIPVVAAACVGGVLLTAAVVRRPGEHLKDAGATIMGMAVAMMLYVGGAIAFANTELDESAPQVFHVKVLKAFRSGGPYQRWYVVLGAWGGGRQNGGHDDDEAIRVGQQFYDAVHPGQIVTVRRHPGWLGLPWYTVDTH